MTWFRDFSTPLWEIFGGSLLLCLTIVFYIAWWVISFRPDGKGNAAGAGIFIMAALFIGLVAIAFLALGITSLPQVGKGFPLVYILPGAVVLYLLLLALTQFFFQREVTAELLLITFWGALEVAAIAVLQGSGRFNLGQVLGLMALVALATIVGLVCYVLHYRLDEIPRFWNGLVPLAADLGVVMVFMATLALS